MAAMNVPAHQDAKVIHAKVAYAAENGKPIVPVTLADEMQLVVLSTKTQPNATARHFIQTEIHTLNVRAFCSF